MRDPVWVYWAAALLTVRPFSEQVIRAPSATAGVLNVVLLFVLARMMFGRTRPAVVAAVLLMLTPAHFVQSRIATMQIAPVTCTIVWLIFMVRYSRDRKRRDLVAASACLGFGMYTYVAALVIMPLYFAVTLVVAWRLRATAAPSTHLPAACAAFAVALVPLVLWFVAHPQQLVGLTGYYTHGEYNQNLGWRGFLGANAISHLDAWWDCYNPDKLFFSGDPDLRFSTRSAGHFLLGAAVPMAAGIWHARRLLGFVVWALLACGLLLAPLPAAVVTNSEIKRWLTFVPFAILAAAAGVEWMLSIRRSGRACAIALALLVAVQATLFFGYYFGRYRVTAGEKLGGNLRDAIREVIVVSNPQDCVLFAVSPYYLHNQWELYTRAYGRPDLTSRTTTRFEETLACPGATALAVPGDARFANWRATPIRELDGTVRLVVYRR